MHSPEFALLPEFNETLREGERVKRYVWRAKTQNQRRLDSIAAAFGT